MNILFTNDDGYQSDGFKVLINLFKKHHKVYICAPLKEKSSVSHAITLSKKMKYLEIENGYAIDGAPADCVKTALFGFFKKIKFNLIISGINKGINMGHDIFYSGTVAGAREGYMNNISAIACSKDCDSNYQNFDSCAKKMLKIVTNIESFVMKEKIFLNINFPDTKYYEGLKLTHLGNRIYNNTVYFEEENNEKFVSLIGDALKFDSDKGSDLDTVSEGFISVTPLSGTKENYSPIYNNEILSALQGI